jgi:hypothetical protein
MKHIEILEVMTELIQWMEEERLECIMKLDPYGEFALEKAIAKAKELQEKERVKQVVSEMTETNQQLGLYGKEKWAVVHKNDTFNTLEEAEKTKAGWLIDTTDYVTVKIIEP